MSTISSVRSARSDLLLNRFPMIGSSAQERDCRRVVLCEVVEETGDHERLAVAKLDLGLRPPG